MVIGIMDSGIGGLNLLARLLKLKCADRYLYFADTEHLPYGSKGAERLREIAFRGVERLRERGANVVIFGCNTLSVCALDAVRKRTSLPLFGLLPRPELTYGKTLFMTTPTTSLFLPPLTRQSVLLTPPRLAALIERFYPDTREIARYLSPLLAPYGDMDCAYLGCSHYLFATEVIRASLPKAKILENVTPLAALVKAVLPVRSVKSQNVDFLFSGQNEESRYAEILSSLLS